MQKGFNLYQQHQHHQHHQQLLNNKNIASKKNLFLFKLRVCVRAYGTTETTRIEAHFNLASNQSAKRDACSLYTFVCMCVCMCCPLVQTLLPKYGVTNSEMHAITLLMALSES